MVTGPLFQVIIPCAWLFSTLFISPLFFIIEEEGRSCVRSWPKKWMSKTYNFAWSTLVFVSLLVMIVLYSRVIYALCSNTIDGNEATCQQQVSITPIGPLKHTKRLFTVQPFSAVSVVIWNCFTSKCDWSRKLAPHSQSVNFKSKAQWLGHSRFPRFMQFACFYSECSLAPRDVFLVLIGCCDCFSSGFKGSLEKRSTYVIPYGIKNTQSLIRWIEDE